ncbi:MAG: DUF2752 domain-containing protein [Luteolibacter sp.]
MIARFIRRRPWTLAVLGCAAGFFFLRASLPKLARWVPPCGFRRWTGWWCPGCGGTRCTMRLIHGDVAGAWAMNPLAMILGGAFAGWMLLGLVCEWRGRRMPAMPSWLAWFLPTLILVFWLARNLPWWPFTLLAPHR